MGNIIMTVDCNFRCADSRLDVVDEDGRVFETTTKDISVVWADSNAGKAIVTVLLLHLNRA